MNEQAAIVAITRGRYSKNLCVPRYTPCNWWECDVFEVTPAGMFREYEIKLTVADFKADAQKRNVKEHFGSDYGFDFHCFGRWCEYPCETKRDLLSQRSPRCPSRFWYVTPEGLLTDSQLPERAGLIELRATKAASSKNARSKRLRSCTSCQLTRRFGRTHAGSATTGCTT